MSALEDMEKLLNLSLLKGDIETIHWDADQLLCDELIRLGHSDLVEV